MDYSNFDRCTFTGVDQHTDLKRLIDISLFHNSGSSVRVEWGILYSPSRSGSGRFPTLSQIEDIACVLSRNGIDMALHLCGNAVGDLMSGRLSIFNDVPSNSFSRVQLNVNVTKNKRYSSQALRDFILSHDRTSFITQHNRSNYDLTARLVDVKNHSILFDASGGRGATPSSWPRHLGYKKCGYAGGLGPGTLIDHLPMIHGAAEGHGYWIDMEGKIRDDQDILDLDKTKRCLEIVRAFTRGNLMANNNVDAIRSILDKE